MKTLRSLLRACCRTNGGEDEALTDAKNQEHYLKVKQEDQNPNRNPLAELSVEKNPGAFQKSTTRCTRGGPNRTQTRAAPVSACIFWRVFSPWLKLVYPVNRRPHRLSPAMIYYL